MNTMNNLMKPLNEEYSTPYEISKLHTYSFKELSNFKQFIEAKLHTLVDDLHKQNISMDTSLLTRDGFPRNDIDVLDVRLKRVEIIKLKNDLEKILSELYNKMDSQFNEVKQTTMTIPFLQITEIGNTSPLLNIVEINDKIIKFNQLNASNFKSLSQLASSLTTSTILNLTIKRNDTIKDLEIKHTGSLGVKMVPI